MKNYKYYGAYGSNLNLGQMMERCPEAKVVCKAKLRGYRLQFSGSLNIVKEKQHSVPIAVYKISERDEKNLDRYEGFPNSYTKMYRDVRLSTGEVVGVMFYVMQEPRASVESPSTDYYLQTCLVGADNWDFTEFEKNKLKRAWNRALRSYTYRLRKI